MGLFHRKKEIEPKSFDREHLEPVIRCSICTGEQEAGFRDKRTGTFTSVQLLRDAQDLKDFCAQWGVEEPRKIY